MVHNNTYGPFNDLWAFGVILYEMITGDLPFMASNEQDLFDIIMDP
jgi:serine/threonine protein kinase